MATGCSTWPPPSVCVADGTRTTNGCPQVAVAGSSRKIDHWPQCYTALVAGGGVKRGYVYGSSDKFGAYPANDPVKPDDLAATMFTALGIDPQIEVQDSLNRPLQITRGKPIMDLFA